jgi:hypothetical protein
MEYSVGRVAPNALGGAYRDQKVIWKLEILWLVVASIRPSTSLYSRFDRLSATAQDYSTTGAI